MLHQKSLKARNDSAGLTPGFQDWSEKYLPHYFTHRPYSDFHLSLAEDLESLQSQRGQKLNRIAPRGNAKSTWSTFAYPLYCAVHGLEPYIILTADTTAQACKYLDSIRAELEDSPAIARDYPQVAGRGPIWREDRIQLRNGVVIEALGTGSKLRGRKNRQRRPSLIIVDDPQNTGHILSALQRERSWEWITKDVLNAGDPETNILVLGTALHPDCIVMRLQRTPGWRSKTWQSITQWPERMDLWAKWELDTLCNWELDDEEREAKAKEFYAAHRSEMDRGAEVLWPSREPLYDLMCLRATVGVAAFGSEKQSDPINPDACEWPPEYFERPGFWFDQWPTDYQLKTLALDPSKGRNDKIGDFWAYVKLLRCPKGVLYIEAELRKGPINQMVDTGLEIIRDWNPDGFAIETNQFQELLVTQFQAPAIERRIDLPIYQIDNSVNKEVRIRRLTPDLAQSRIRFKSRSPGTQLLVDQLKSFPQGDHDDGPDALEMAKRLAVHLDREKHAKRLNSKVKS